MKVYILTEEYNEYDQYGEYFIAWFQYKPTIEDLRKVISESDITLNHILSGGGRISYENSWYYLKEVDSIN